MKYNYNKYLKLCSAKSRPKQNVESRIPITYSFHRMEGLG